jgi:hypothetical protein
MKIVIRAAMTALSLASIGPAYAGVGAGIAANARFSDIPGVIAQAQVQNAPYVATARNGQVIRAYVTNSNRGTWLFAPNTNSGANS